MRWLFSTDWHLCDRRPGTRVDDDFFETQTAKVKEIFTIADNEQVDLILHGGDFFDHPLMDLHLINSTIQLLKLSPVPIRIIFGSHDVLGYNIDTRTRTAIGTLLKAGVVELVKTEAFGINATTKHTVELYKGIEQQIILTHNMLLPKEVIFEHILCDTIAPVLPEGSIVLCGHYHQPFNHFNEEHQIRFINPGCLIRTDISEATHAPMVLIGEDNQFLKKVKLASAKLGSTIFDTIAHQEVKQRENAFNTFVASLKIAKSTTEQYDLETLIMKVAKEQKIDATVRNEALTRIRIQATSLPA